MTINLKSKLQISSPAFDIRQTASMTACLEISSAEISVAVFSGNKELLYLEQFLLKPGEKISGAFEGLCAQSELFRQNYAHVYVSAAVPHFTLVPGALFDPANKEALLRFNHPLHANEIVLSDEIYGAETFCVFGLDNRLKQLLDKTFPNNHVRHLAGPLLESLSGMGSKTRKTCLVNVRTEQLDVALYDRRLKFFNSFTFQTSEDFLYYILASLEQNGFLLDETEVVLAGEIETGSALHDTLRKYIPKMRFAVPTAGIVKKLEFTKLPEHFFYSLFNLYLCAL